MRTPAKQLSELFEQLSFPEISPRYNIAPTQTVLAVRQTEQGTLETAMLRWGLVPSWADDLKIGARMINARSETVASKPSFRSAFKKRRCLILADGFYEWKKTEDGKQPFYIHRRDDQPFCLAGLWESWEGKQAANQDEAEKIETCTILTTSANETLKPLHERMPVILSREEARRDWLDVGLDDRQALENLLVPSAASELEAFPVSKAVNKPAYDRPDCIQRLEG